ncbi:nitrogen fixation protein NifS [Elstera cyanobacteriorum]|uniref:Nitrogen fixation protein NifS n=1 Tax=Elstera cyanobacteriorum TaxID=2022747 RepID=A0A255XI89_9PROT|nr:aminotransferase class V-fold PLP-dependent enzyme [Elstera cyanobacteriorum]OYQ16658.1 nitrogen fixation protein NifS [Elstera cyanobacteriorum]
MRVTGLDIEFVRRQFPAFAEPSLAGQAHFENAGGSYACGPVIERLARYYRETKLQPYGVHPASRRAGEEMDQAHARLADYLGMSAEEVHLGPSTSQNTYVLAQAVAKKLQPGDEIIVTNQDHEANSGVWRRLAEHGFTVREWRINPQTGTLDPNDLDGLLTERTRVVAFPHCSNILGEINPVAAICAKIHRVPAIAVVDGVSYAGHGLPDVRALGVDIYLFSLYKTFGPHLGALAIDRKVMEWLGNQGHYFNGAFPHKWFVPAGPDHAQVAATNGIFDYFDALHRHHFQAGDTATKAADVRTLLRTAELAPLQKLLDFCREHPRLRIVGPDQASQRAATVALETLAATPREIAAKLAERGIIAGASHFYAVRLLEALKLDPATGVLRLSFVHYTSPAEIDQLLTALEQIV